MRRTGLTAAIALCLCVFAVGLPAAAIEDFSPRKVNVDDLEIADCILPGQIRSLGRMTYQTPRRLARLSRGECALKGGEAKIYDRTDTKSALDAWLPVAEQGDLEAMNRVGLIYEGAYGGEPNLERAAAWYRRAAEGGYKPAQYSLATMLEQGKGVPKNVMEALEWYRKASGIQNDSLRLSSDAQRELEALRTTLEGQLGEAQSQIDLLEAQIKNLQADVERQRDRTAAVQAQAQSQVRTLSNLVAQLRRDADAKRVQLAAVPVFRTPSNVAAPTLSGAQLPVTGAARQAGRTQLGNADMGKYYALVIGNQKYQHMEPLSTPVVDARRIADLLEQRYGFQVMLLLNADATTIKQAINELDRRATAKDNVLIYFAGHGVIRNIAPTQTPGRPANARTNLQGFWLPVEAETARDTFWIDNMWVTEHLALNHAKRVLVVADSCYAGLFSADPSVLLSNNPDYSAEEIKELIGLRARFVLSSGDVKPVLDRGGDGHSVFARAFIDVLQRNQGVLSSVALYRDVFEQVAVSARRLGMEQLPQLRPIRPAGHEWGEFFFVPRG